MPHPPLIRRVEILEEKVDTLSQLPERLTAVEVQLVAMRGEIRAGDEETRRHMRVLHEDVISRIVLLQEGIDRRNGGSRRAAHKPPPSKRGR
jgi:hypothetical protein